MLGITIRPLQGRDSFVDYDPVALPPAIEFVRYADGTTSRKVKT